MKDSTNVITVRIDEELNKSINKVREKLGISKADIIRNYLEMSKFMIKQKSTLQTIDDRDFIMVKRDYFRNLIEKEEEDEQIRLGDELAHFINDCARIKGKLNDITYKLDLCENIGFFRKFIDEENYILIDKKFGPQKFAEAFIWRIFNQSEFNANWITSKIDDQSKIRAAYQKQVQPLDRSTSHYSFEFAKVIEEGKE